MVGAGATTAVAFSMLLQARALSELIPRTLKIKTPCRLGLLKGLVFSNLPDFGIANRMIAVNPEVRRGPRSQIV